MGTNVTAAAISPNGQWLAVVGPDDRLQLCELEDQAKRSVSELSSNHWHRPLVTFSPDNRSLAWVEQLGEIRLWSLADDKEFARINARHHRSNSLGLAFSPDPTTLAYTTGNNGEILLWDLESHSVVRRFIGHKGPVYVLAFSPDGH